MAAAAAIAIVLWLLGFSYNFWAKRTRLSWLPFAGFYPSLPLWGFVAAEKFTPTLLLTYPVCALLAVGLNVANTLPDLERDLAGGVKGFTHRLGTVAGAHPALAIACGDNGPDGVGRPTDW